MSDAFKSLDTFIGLEIAVLVGSLLAIISYRLLTGKINTSGMLMDSTTGKVSSSRVQVLVITVFAALYYVSLLPNTPGKFPPVPQEMLLILSGSHTVYLGGKASLLSQLFSSSPDN